MKEKLEQKILTKFPEIYSLYSNRNSQITYPIQFGFEHGDGWFDLIYKLSQQIYNHVKEKYDIASKDIPKVAQVKEKFGNLRFYMNSADDYIYNLIEEAENKSKFICENCGVETDGKHKITGRWIINRCNKCWEEFKHN